ncbi:MAG TPA: PorV/PorQ family protein [bacterium (Candidatus Stahlbacteria)]|nr:PorV/PorQ family protein [Candidatus Stahlbacteria bacterium]
MKIRIWVITTFMLSMVASSSLSANGVYDFAGTAAFNPFEIAIGARQVGMGGAFSAMSDDIYSIAYNPAALALLTQKELTLYHNSWFIDAHQSFMAFAAPSEKYGCYGLGINYFNEGKIDEYVDGTPTGERLGAYDVSMIFGYGGRFNNYLALGLNAKFMQRTLSGWTSSSICIDIGTLVPVLLDNKLSVGLAIQNIGTGVKFRDLSFSEPFNVKIGVASQLPVSKMVQINFAGDLNKPNDANVRLNLGTEFWVNDILALRLGYREGYDISESKIAYGLGIKYKNFRIDYAYVGYGSLGPTHRLSIGMRFAPIGVIAGPVRIEEEQMKELKKEIWLQSWELKRVIREESDTILKDITNIKATVEEIKKILKTKLKVEVTPKEILHFVPVHFDFDSYDIRPEDYDNLKEVARIITTYYRDKLITIEGHCDVAGTKEYNLKLSKLRAESVKQFLVKQGVPASQLQTVGYGKERPVTPKRGPGETGIENRRVVFVLEEDK